MTVAERFSRAHSHSGFGWVRLLLAIGILTFHSVTISYGSADAIAALPAACARLILPAAFALSGFLVAASLTRSASLAEFATFRIVRLAPALVSVVLVTSLVLGPLMTIGDWRDYFANKDLALYIGNIIAHPHYILSGVFLHNPRPGVVNGSLWTIPVELWCYLSLSIAFLFGLMQRKGTLALAGLITFSSLALGAYCGHGNWLAALPTGNLALPFLAGVILFAGAEVIPYHGFLAALSLAGAAILSSTPQWPNFAVLPLAYATIWAGLQSLPRWPGDYSYGLYLVGYPLQQTYVSLVPGGPWWRTWLICLPLALGCAVLLWHFVEKPLLMRKVRFVPRIRQLRVSRLWRAASTQLAPNVD